MHPSTPQPLLLPRQGCLGTLLPSVIFTSSCDSHSNTNHVPGQLIPSFVPTCFPDTTLTLEFPARAVPPYTSTAPKLFLSTNTEPSVFAAPSVVFGVQQFFEYKCAVTSTLCSCLLDTGDVTAELLGEFLVHPLLWYHSIQTYELTNFVAVNSRGLLRIWTLVYKMGILC